VDGDRGTAKERLGERDGVRGFADELALHLDPFDECPAPEAVLLGVRGGADFAGLSFGTCRFQPGLAVADAFGLLCPALRRPFRVGRFEIPA